MDILPIATAPERKVPTFYSHLICESCKKIGPERLLCHRARDNRMVCFSAGSREGDLKGYIDESHRILDDIEAYGILALGLTRVCFCGMKFQDSRIYFGHLSIETDTWEKELMDLLSTRQLIDGYTEAHEMDRLRKSTMIEQKWIRRHDKCSGK